jgi:nucleoside 2-deoxyribosyltransferase
VYKETVTIYFAGSIRGGRDDQQIYRRIIELLKQHGTVVTEHVGDADISLGGENAPDCHIHDRDLDWLRQSDVIVAEVTAPSLGVGYEIGRAVEWKKPIICLYRPSSGRKLSGMIAGCRELTVHEYQEVEQLRDLLQDALRERV